MRHFVERGDYEWVHAHGVRTGQRAHRRHRVAPVRYKESVASLLQDTLQHLDVEQLVEQLAGILMIGQGLGHSHISLTAGVVRR